MADTTINGLTSWTPTTDDLLVFYDNADWVTKKSAISALPVGAGDMVLASTQTNSGLKTFLAATFGLRNVANTFTSFFTNTNTAARTYTLQNRNGTLSDDTDLATKAALAWSISQVFSVSQLEVGNASDTSITRSSAGVIAVEWVVVDTISGANTLTNKTLTTPVIASIKWSVVTDTDGATITFDKNTWDFHRVVLGGNRTLALSNMAAGDKIVIDLIQDGTGTRTVTWFTTIKWTGWTVPTLTTTINKIDTFGFICTSAGNYQGYIIGQNL